MFRNVQTEIVIASCPHPVGEKADTCAHRHSRVGIEQHVAVDAACVEKRERIVAQCHETRHQRAQGTNGQPRLAISHPSSLQSERVNEKELAREKVVLRLQPEPRLFQLLSDLVRCETELLRRT